MYKNANNDTGNKCGSLTLIMAKHQYTILNKDLNEFIIASHVLSNTMRHKK